MSAAKHNRTPRTWSTKFRDAFRGVGLGMRDQASFRVHWVFAAAVVIAAVVLHVSVIEWCVLVLCITAVLVAEMFNTALEWMARAVDRRENPHLGGALDVASAAVLLGAVGAAIVGLTVFSHRLGILLQWWSD